MARRMGRVGNTILAMFAIVFVIMYLPDDIKNYNPFDKKAIYAGNINKKLNQIKNVVPLKINEPTELDGLTKADIYKIRKNYVKDSIFWDKSYEPSNDVFGQIEDNRPWYGLEYSGCMAAVKGSELVKDGPSEESRFINNPNMLIGVECGGYDTDKNDSICKDKAFWLMPEKLTYDGRFKTIKAEYKLPYAQKCSLVGINARDLGYNYIHAGSTSNIKFKNGPSAKTSVYSFKDYIHKGPSCGLEGGCNNGSPYQSEVAFDYIPKNYNSSIFLSLWMYEPNRITKRPDLKYIISIHK